MSGDAVSPFYSIRGYVSCPWYRQALCIAQEFIDQHQQPETVITDADTSSSSSSSPTVQIDVHSMSPMSYTNHLSGLREQMEIQGHNSCPIILQGTCHYDQQRAATSNSDAHSASTSASAAASMPQCSVQSYVGGYSEWARLLSQRYGFKPERCSIENTRRGSDRC